MELGASLTASGAVLISLVFLSLAIAVTLALTAGSDRR
jgi:hypothetical protein